MTASPATTATPRLSLEEALAPPREPRALVIGHGILRDTARLFREHFAGRRVGVILSGGNVDIDALPW